MPLAPIEMVESSFRGNIVETHTAETAAQVFGTRDRHAGKCLERSVCRLT
jgi:hypothetical protein